MKIRAIALALPLMVGVACKTSSTQSGSRTARNEPQQAGATAGAQAGAGGASASGNVSGSTTGTPSASGDVTTPGTAGTGSTASGDVYGTPRTGSDTSAGGTAGSMGSEDVKGHSDDQVVSGKISKVSSGTVTITSGDGMEKTLRIVPQTTVQVDGQDARGADLQEGQPVRASFSTVENQDVAVEIHAGQGADSSGSSGSMHQEPGSMHDQMHDQGSTGTSTKDSGTSSPSGTTGSDRKY